MYFLFIFFFTLVGIVVLLSNMTFWRRIHFDFLFLLLLVFEIKISQPDWFSFYVF